MGCAAREIRKDLVDGGLGVCETTQASDHIRSGSKCKWGRLEILAFHEGLRSAVASDACPSQTTLEAYTRNLLPRETMAAIREATQAPGAGKELQSRLVEMAPPVLPRFPGLSDVGPCV